VIERAGFSGGEVFFVRDAGVSFPEQRWSWLRTRT
jgi:hypothetical protein